MFVVCVGLFMGFLLLLTALWELAHSPRKRPARGRGTGWYRGAVPGRSLGPQHTLQPPVLPWGQAPVEPELSLSLPMQAPMFRKKKKKTPEISAPQNSSTACTPPSTPKKARKSRPPYNGRTSWTRCATQARGVDPLRITRCSSSP